MRKKIRIAIYSRKSKYTDKGDSIGNQIELAKEYINANYPSDRYDVEIVVYEDEGFSGGNIDRPHFQKFLKDQERQPYDILICYRLDRISRNIANFSKLMEDLTAVDTSFVSIKEQFDTKTPMGRAMMYIASVFAQLEREVIAERVRDNMLELAKTGRWLGGDAPTGFSTEKYEIIQVYDEDEEADNILEKKNKKACKLITNEEEKELILFLFDKYLEFKSLSRLEYYCLVNDIKTKHNKRFSKSTLRLILANPVYAKNDKAVLQFFNEKGIEIYAENDGREKFDGKYGLLSYNKRKNSKLKKNYEDWIIAVGLHEGFISGEKWVQVQRIMEENKLDYRFRSTVYSKNDVVFSGILKCGDCHNKMKVITSGKDYPNGEKRYYYVCTKKKLSKGLHCQGHNISGRELDRNVVNILKSVFVPNSDVYNELKNMTLSKKEISVNGEADSLRKKIDKNNEEIKSLVNKLKYIDVEIIDIVNDEIKKLKKDNNILEEKIKKLEAESKKENYESDTARFVLNIINNCFDSFDLLNLKDRKDILNMFIEDAYVIGDHAVELKLLNTRLDEKVKQWYYHHNMIKEREDKNINGDIEEPKIEIYTKSEDISKIFKKVKDKGILAEPLKYDTEKEMFVDEIIEKPKDFVDYIRQYREAKRMYKSELAEKIGLDESTYRKYETRRLKIQNPKLVEKIMKALDMKEEDVEIPEYVKFLNSNPNEKIKNYIEENNLTYRDFSKIIGVNEETVSAWVNKDKRISVNLYNKLKKANFKNRNKSKKNDKEQSNDLEF